MEARIGFDARAAFLDRFRGFGRVTRSLAESLLDLAPGEIVLFVPHGVSVPPRWYAGAAEVVHLHRPRRGAFLFDGPAWRWTLHRHPVDVLHLPTWGVPPAMPVPVVATFYDAIPFRFASPPGWWRRLRARRAIRSLARATAVHAISSFARDECLATVRIDPERVTAVPLGVRAPFGPAPQSLPPTHLLFVGGADPHKNFDLILAMLSMDGAEQLPPLLLAGPAATTVATSGLTRLRGRVIPATPMGDEQLAALYRSAVALLLPSRCEGFGLPAIEAMACGCPVLAARAGSLPEVCGGAAVLLDPDQPAAWLRAVLDLIARPGRRAELIAAGLSRAAEFTWARTARGLLELYRAATRLPSSRS